MDAVLFPVVAVVGPTGSGKSELGLRIAAEYGGEIVNCDSLQVYRRFNLGTAKLPLEERRGIPHHLIDIIDPDEPFDAGEYAHRAREALAAIRARGRLPLVVGGTGFYLRALTDGLFRGPGRDDALRERLSRRERRRPGALHRVLRRLDPEASRKIHPNDAKKCQRALEVRLLSGRPISELFREGKETMRGARFLKVGLDPPRDALYHSINARCERMFEAGLVEEVRGILDRGYKTSIKPLTSVGYKQALQFLEGQIPLSDAIRLAQQCTRQYAKRQWTWFHHEKEVLWYTGFGHDPALQADVLKRVRELLADFPHFS